MEPLEQMERVLLLHTQEVRSKNGTAHPVWPENSIRRIPSATKGYISVRNFGICESASVLETSRIKQETPKPWTRRIAPACQPFMTDTGAPAVHDYAGLDRAGEVGHCWFIQTAREISRKRNGSRHFDIGSSHYRRSQGLSPAVSDRSSFRAIRDTKWSTGRLECVLGHLWASRFCRFRQFQKSGF